MICGAVESRIGRTLVLRDAQGQTIPVDIADDAELWQVGTIGDTGLAVGLPVPDVVVHEFPQVLSGRTYLLFLSPHCGPCLDLVPTRQ